MSSSPVKSGRLPASIKDDTFSPVKLPNVRTPELKNNNKDFDVVKQHPHGLTAKHEARGRRNTLHNYSDPSGRRSLVATPLNVPQAASENVPKYPLTSPRNTIKKFNIDSIKKSKKSLDMKLSRESPVGKENNDPFGSSTLAADLSLAPSSPIKRNHDEPSSARKIAKVVTNANESSYQSDTLVQINEVFYREDLVAQLSSTKSSPRRSGGISKYTAQKPTTVVDNDSDSDPDDYGRIENTISQTIVPNTTTVETNKYTTSYNSDNHTQLNKIIKIDDKTNAGSYLTPQRYTEPIAKSPATNQQVRINEALNLENSDDNDEGILGSMDQPQLKDATSPLKNHPSNLYNDSKKFSTTNSVDIPESLKEDQEYDDVLPEVERLENEPTINFLMSPNSKPVFSIDQINKMQDDDRKKVDYLKDEILKKNDTVRTLHQELATIKSEFASKQQETFYLRDEKDVLVRNEEILSIQLKHNERELASLTKSFKMKESTIAGLKHKLNDAKVQSQETISSLTRQVEELTTSNNADAIRMEEILQEKEELLKALEEANTIQAELAKENGDLKEINSKQEELLKELDNLENLANDKIYNLEKNLQLQKTELGTKADEFSKEREILTNQINQLEEDKIQQETQIHKQRRSVQQLNEELRDSTNMINKLNLKIDSLESEISKMTQVDAETTRDLKALIKEKDEIIAEDVTKMNELVLAIENKKRKHQEEIQELQQDIKRLKEDSSMQQNKEVEYLKQQLKEQELDAQKKFDDIAAFLHKQYAEKHTRKLGEVRDQYEKELSLSNLDKKALHREVDLLKRKLNRAVEEVQKVNEFVHVHKLLYPNSGSYTSKSPNKSRTTRY